MNLTLKSLISSLSLLFALNSGAQILYKVEGKDLEKPSYLFGTHHLAPIAVIEKTGADTPFRNASQVVGEIDMTQDQIRIGLAMQPHMIAPEDSTLSKVIAPEDYAIINEEFKKWSPMPGMDLRAFDQLKPMVATTTVAVGMAASTMPEYNPAQQLDTYFQTEGKAEGKTIIALETPEHQATVLFDSTPIAYQAEALVEMLKNPQKAIDATNELTAAYNEENLDKMLKLSQEDDRHPEFMMELLDRRNADWLTKLPEIMSQGDSFIAVGALHLAGDQGLIEGLRKLGYTVTPVK